MHHELEDEEAKLHSKSDIVSEAISEGPVRPLILQGSKAADKPEAYPLWISTRLAITSIAFLGSASLYTQRAAMSVAIVCMVNNTALQLNKLDNNDTSMDNFSQEISNGRGEFAWEKPVQGLVLGSFFYGYMTTQLAGGWLATYFGGKRILGGSLLLCSIASILTPVGARLHYGVVVALRIFSGVTQGVFFPAMYALWSRWAPPHERSRLLAYAFAGTEIGSVLAMSISGLLCEYGFDNGWPSIFYLFGSLGIIWVIAWMIIVSDSPAKHPKIDKKEQLYIEHSLKGELDEKTKIPWLSIMSSLPFWGIIISAICWLFGFYMFFTNMPTYLKEVLKFDPKSNGLVSALPFIALWLMAIASSTLADYIRIQKLLSVTWIRKLFNSLGHFLPVIFVLVLGHIGMDQYAAAVALLVLAVGFNGIAAGAGSLINMSDIAPSYAGVLMGIANTFGSIPGFVVPQIVAALTKNGTQEEWQHVFYVTCGFYTFGGIFYLVAASGTVQPWAVKSSRTTVQVEE